MTAPDPFPPSERGGVRRVAVFRALMLGDLLCATPALRALRAGLPGATVALVGLPWARVLAERLDSVDEFIEFPGWEGLPERAAPDGATALAFLQSMRERRFDLALQMHGSGGIVNPLVDAFGAARSAGFADAHAWRPARDAALYAPWPEHGTEVERMLALTDHLGLPRQGERLDFPLRDTDREQASALLRGLITNGDAAPAYAIVHPGSQLPSRRWPAERFALVADRLAGQGLAILLTGTAAESGLTTEVARAMRHPAHDLTGRTDLWTLGALVERARVVVSNDTGISHIAAALATRSVIVASGSDVRRWSPADAARHRVFWHDIACRPCAYPVCPIGQACALAVPTDDVARAASAAALHP